MTIQWFACLKVPARYSTPAPLTVLHFSWILSGKLRLQVLAFSNLLLGDGIILEKDNCGSGILAIPSPDWATQGWGAVWKTWEKYEGAHKLWWDPRFESQPIHADCHLCAKGHVSLCMFVCMQLIFVSFFIITYSNINFSSI